MSLIKGRIDLILIVILISCTLFLEVEGRRKILRGRKTITRRYYRGIDFPGWLKVLAMTSGILAINGVLFFVVRKYVITANQPLESPNRGSIEHEV